MTRLTLAEAIEQGRLQDFVSQAEADGVGPADQGDFDARLERIVKAPRQEDRTSRSRARDGSPGK